jgi:TonB-linked SusC/RagA family outer membrane protein
MTGPKWVTLLGASLVISGMGVSQVAAQAAVITGRVTSERGDPLPAASVRVGTTNFGASATSTGSYTITIDAAAVRGQQVTLTAQAIGYSAVSRVVTLRAGSQEQNFSLKADPFRLDELISTGVAAATSARKLPFAVGKVGAEELQEVPGSNALVALQGKVAGLRVVPASGQPGGEVSLRLRGSTSIGGRQDPLFIVDGVITQFGLADIAAEDVERIEVIKGAAASSLYGSNAANGVVQVFTKRGASLPDGTLQVTSRFEAGVNQMPRRIEFSRSHAFEINSSPNYCSTLNPDYTVDPVGNYCLNGAARVVTADQIADNPFTVYNDHWDQLVDPGKFWTGYFSVGQRRGSTNFNASFQNTKNQGVIFGLGGYDRQNFRMNLDQQLSSNIDASFSMFFGRSTNGRAAEGQTGPFFGLMFLQPDVDILAPNPDGSPYKAQVPLSGDVANDFNPLYELANRKISRDRNRFSGSSRARWRMTDWLSAEGSFAYDQAAQDDSDVTPFGFLTSSGTKTEGRLVKEQRNDRQYNAGVTLSATRNFGKITNTTKLSATFEDQKNRYLASTANKLIVERVPEFGGSDPAAQRAQSREEHIRNRNFFAITTFDINDRYILDGLIRRDGSSLFGPESRWTTYYRLSGAWRANEDLQIKGIDELRFRASYGTAGLRPQFNDQFEILEVTPGGFTKQILGNPLLKPARSAELELGANLEFGGGRVALEYTYASKKTKDQILLVDLPSVVGFKQQWQNTGKLEAKTHELALSAQLINTRSTAWTVRIVGDRTRQVITEWNLPERLYSFEQMPSAFFLGNGSNLGVLYGNHWVRDIEELYDDPDRAAQSGAGQAWSRDSVMINEDGYVVRKSLYGTPDERAIKYTFCKTQDATGACTQTSQIVQIGDANPDFNLSFSTGFNFKRFAVNALLDWSQGGDLYNGTRQWAFQATRDKVQDQAGKPAGAQKALPYYGVGFYNGLDPNDFFVEDGSYAKLKEFSVNYTFVNDQLRKIGLGKLNEVRLGFIARNLFTITNYSGMDPEVQGLFGDPFQVRMDWFQYPQFRTFTAVVEIAF